MIYRIATIAICLLSSNRAEAFTQVRLPRAHTSLLKAAASIDEDGLAQQLLQATVAAQYIQQDQTVIVIGSDGDATSAPKPPSAAEAVQVYLENAKMSTAGGEIPTICQGGYNNDDCVIVGETADAVVIACRGTITGKGSSYADLSDWTRNDFEAQHQFVDGWEGFVHQGMYRASGLLYDSELYDKLKPQIEAEDSKEGESGLKINKPANFILDCVKERLERSPSKKIYVTGHSKGGGMSTIIAWMLYNSKDPVIKKAGKPKVWTFASPRVGSTEFVADYNSQLDQLSFENANDIVPLTPNQPHGGFGSAKLEYIAIKEILEAVYHFKNLPSGSELDYMPAGTRYIYDAKKGEFEVIGINKTDLDEGWNKVYDLLNNFCLEKYKHNLIGEAGRLFFLDTPQERDEFKAALGAEFGGAHCKDCPCVYDPVVPCAGVYQKMVQESPFTGSKELCERTCKIFHTTMPN